MKNRKTRIRKVLSEFEQELFDSPMTLADIAEFQKKYVVPRSPGISRQINKQSQVLDISG